jgi:hypothetical protein
MNPLVHHDTNAARGLRRAAGFALAGLLCAVLAACGDGSSNNASGGATAVANAAPAGAGGASAPVAIVSAPTASTCAAAANGIAASQPLLNTQLNCAP